MSRRHRGAACSSCGKTPAQAVSCACGYGASTPQPERPLDLNDPVAVMRARRELIARAQADIDRGTDELMKRIDRYIEES